MIRLLLLYIKLTLKLIKWLVMTVILLFLSALFSVL